MWQDPSIIVLNKPHGMAVQVSHLYLMHYDGLYIMFLELVKLIDFCS